MVLEEGIEELGRYLFTGCEKLHQITVPDSVKRVTPDSFHRIPNLNLPVLNASGTEYIYCPPKLGEKRLRFPMEFGSFSDKLLMISAPWKR